MHFTRTLLQLTLCTFSLGNAQHERKDVTSIDMSSILSQASRLTAQFPSATGGATIPFTVPGGNLLQPPATLIGAIITGVPASALVQLAQPSGRSAIAAEFKAGSTPVWYQTLPSPVKSYIESLNTQIAAGHVDLNATASTFSFPAPPAATSATSATHAGGPQKIATTSSKGIAPQATAEVGVAFAAVVGFLGVAIAL